MPKKEKKDHPSKEQDNKKQENPISNTNKKEESVEEVSEIYPAILDASDRPLETGDYVFFILPSNLYADVMQGTSLPIDTPEMFKSIGKEKLLNDFSPPQVGDGLIIGIDDNEIIAKVLNGNREDKNSSDNIVILPSYCFAKINTDYDMDRIMTELDHDLANWRIRREAYLMSTMFK